MRQVPHCIVVFNNDIFYPLFCNLLIVQMFEGLRYAKKLFKKMQKILNAANSILYYLWFLIMRGWAVEPNLFFVHYDYFSLMCCTASQDVPNFVILFIVQRTLAVLFLIFGFNWYPPKLGWSTCYLRFFSWLMDHYFHSKWQPRTICELALSL